jgi:hypothetical protein
MNIKIELCSSWQKIGRAHAQCVGNFFKVIQRDVAHLLRYLRETSAVQVSFKCQRFMRPIFSLTKAHHVYNQALACQATLAQWSQKSSQAARHKLRIFKTTVFMAAV